MHSALIIGLSHFGWHLSVNLMEAGVHITVVDKDEEKIEKLSPLVSNTQIGDCSEDILLRSLEPDSFDVCFVCSGGNFQTSIEVTSLLKELGAKRIISEAGSEIHAKSLLKIGADEVVFPERDIAVQIAAKMAKEKMK